MSKVGRSFFFSPFSFFFFLGRMGELCGIERLAIQATSKKKKIIKKKTVKKKKS